jgi:hypothetical protein
VRDTEILGNLELEIQGDAERSVQDTRRFWIENAEEIEGESWETKRSPRETRRDSCAIQRYRVI